MYHVAYSPSCADKDERLEVFTGLGTSKRAAKEDAARQMALSGYCVSYDDALLQLSGLY